jgi:MFS family permease
MFLLYATQGAVVPLFSLRLQELGFSPVVMGWACAMSALAALATPLVAGQMADRYFSAERCLLVCALLVGVLAWLLARMTSPLAVCATTLAFWLVMTPASTLCAALSFAHLSSGPEFGKVRLWGTIGWVVSGWLLGHWLSQPAWLSRCLAMLGLGTIHAELADAFRLAAFLAFALSAYSLTLPHTPPQRRMTSWLAPLAALRLLRERNFAIYWGCSLGVCITIPFSTQVAPLLLEYLGVPRPWISPTLTLGQSMEIMSLALLPMLLLRFGIRGTMLVGLGAWALFLGILMIGGPLWLVASSLCLNGLCICCFIVAGQVFVNSRAGTDVRASAQALLTFINGLGMLLGNVLVGWVREQAGGAFSPTFGVAAAIVVALTLVFLIGFHNYDLGQLP